MQILIVFSLKNPLCFLDVSDFNMQYRDAYFMRKEINSNAIILEASGVVRKHVSQSSIEQKQQTQQQPLRRGEKERNEWLNRDIRSGSFFENRKTLRQTNQSEQETNPIGNPLGVMTGNVSTNSSNRNNNLNSSPSSMSGKFQRSFHALMHNQHRDPFNISVSSPVSSTCPWEVGPEHLRLPRYRKVGVRVSLNPENSDTNNDSLSVL